MYRHTAPASTWQPPLPPSTGLWTLGLPVNLWLKKTHANLACQARGHMNDLVTFQTRPPPPAGGPKFRDGWKLVVQP